MALGFSHFVLAAIAIASPLPQNYDAIAENDNGSISALHQTNPFVICKLSACQPWPVRYMHPFSEYPSGLSLSMPSTMVVWTH